MFHFFNEAAIINQPNFLLHQAVRDDNLAQVIQLVASGHSLEQQDAEGQTPFFIATFGQKLDIMRALLERGANPNTTWGDQETPLHIATAFGNLKVIELLIRAGANLNALDVEGNTPLRNALLFNHEQVANMLLLGGADPYLVDRDGNTALHFAIERSCDETVRFLVENGMSLSVRNHKNLTPIELAIQNLSSRTVGILAEYHSLSDLEYLRTSLSQTNGFRMQGINHVLTTEINKRQAQGQPVAPSVPGMPR